MGLAERRWLEQLESKVIPEARAYLRDHRAIDPDWQVDQASVADLPLDIVMGLESYGVTWLRDALYEIARDPMGREAVMASIRTIRLRHVTEPGMIGVSLADGVLTFQHNLRDPRMGDLHDLELRRRIEALL